MIKVVRIDERLHHGTVGVQFMENYNIDEIIICNDSMPISFYNRLYMQYQDKTVCISVLTIEDARAYMKDATKQDVIFMVVVQNCADAFLFLHEILGKKQFRVIHHNQGMPKITCREIKSSGLIIPQTDFASFQKVIEWGIEGFVQIR